MDKWTQKESFFEGSKNCRLFFQTWQKPNPKAHILITHGHGEHSECYHRLIDSFKEDSFSFWAWDLRGHGKSEGRRGYAEAFDDYLNDYIFFLNLAFSQIKTPIFLLSHSMGGLIQLKTQILNPNLFTSIQGQCLSAPLLGLALPVPQWKQVGAQYLNQFLPQMTLHNEISNHDLTRDQDVLKEFDRDPLRHNRMSSGVYLGMKESIDLVMSRAAEIQLPTFLQISDSDPIVSVTASKEFIEKIHVQPKSIKLYKDAKHEIFNDIIRSHVFEDLKKNLNSILIK
ncbi:MAG TPA: lysophospholipase [Pseudobdellovibrionaceae bacterium]|nr:lysophospholipase [Pseudobdellovibrionaceae bacterium]